MAKKKPIMTNALRILNAAGIKYDTVEYDYEGKIGEHFGARISKLTGIAPEISFKTLAARGGAREIAVFCIPVERELDLKRAARTAGYKRLEMLHVRELPELIGYARGGVSPIGMKKKYPVFVDASALRYERVEVSAGACGLAVMLAPEDLKKITDCVFAELTRDENVSD